MWASLNTLCSTWEPLIIAAGFSTEILLGIATLTILVFEYIYDKQYNEAKYKKRKMSKHRVKVVIDSDGNARIAEAPKDIDVSIEHEGQLK